MDQATRKKGRDAVEKDQQLRRELSRRYGITYDGDNDGEEEADENIDTSSLRGSHGSAISIDGDSDDDIFGNASLEERRARLYGQLERHGEKLSNLKRYQKRVPRMNEEELDKLEAMISYSLNVNRCTGMTKLLLKRGTEVLADVSLKEETRKESFVKDVLEDEEIPDMVSNVVSKVLLVFPAPVRCLIRSGLYWAHARFMVSSEPPLRVVSEKTDE
jgi:hypothetical protein